MGIKEEITKIAVEQGYVGAKPKSIAQAIDALTDTLAGEDVKSGRSVVDAIRKYAPYIGSGGGGATLGPLVGGWNNDDRSIFCFGTQVPAVGSGSFMGNPVEFASISIGSQIIAGGVSDEVTVAASPIAAGLTVTIALNNPTLYRGTFTVQQNQYENHPVCESFAEFTDYTYDKETGVLTLTIPELASNEFLSIYTP